MAVRDTRARGIATLSPQQHGGCRHAARWTASVAALRSVVRGNSRAEGAYAVAFRARRDRGRTARAPGRPAGGTRHPGGGAGEPRRFDADGSPVLAPSRHSIEPRRIRRDRFAIRPTSHAHCLPLAALTWRAAAADLSSPPTTLATSQVAPRVMPRSAASAVLADRVSGRVDIGEHPIGELVVGGGRRVERDP